MSLLVMSLAPYPGTHASPSYWGKEVGRVGFSGPRVEKGARIANTAAPESSAAASARWFERIRHTPFYGLSMTRVTPTLADLLKPHP